MQWGRMEIPQYIDGLVAALVQAFDSDSESKGPQGSSIHRFCKSKVPPIQNWVFTSVFFLQKVQGNTEFAFWPTFSHSYPRAALTLSVLMQQCQWGTCCILWGSFGSWRVPRCLQDAE